MPFQRSTSMPSPPTSGNARQFLVLPQPSSPNVLKGPKAQYGSRKSWFRSLFVMTLLLLVYMNVVHLNSRYLSEMYESSGNVFSRLFSLGVQMSNYEVLADLPSSIADLPPVYWINLDVSTDRKASMENMFLQMGIKNTTRISAVDVNQTIDLWNSRHLRFHHNITLEAKDGLPSNKKHIENIYEYQEAACLLSHLQAILQAYEDGHDMVLILEDDALLSHSFVSQWKPYVARAPSDWTILQFATNNKNILKQGVNLLDFFITWQPYHWSTRAYILNRKGIEIIVNKTHSISEEDGSDLWTVNETPMVVADEVLYYIVDGGAYTSTGLWVDAASFGSTIQSKNAHSNLTSIVGSSSNNFWTNALLQNFKQVLPETLLILMNARIRDEEEMKQELSWIRSDNEAVCRYHETCEWEVHVVLTDPSLKQAFDEAISHFPPNVHFHVDFFAGTFNKFSYLRNLTGEMKDYDLVMFKDNDQRLAGFPWKTFVSRKGDAVIAGPLRQNMEEALLHRHSWPKRQWFQFHAAEAWTEDWNTKWSPELFAEVRPTDVPVLEMFMVLMDGKFANYFFDMVLIDDFVNQPSSWGPDLLWCPAAKSWKPDKPSCHLVPVTSNHEDTRQITKNTTSHKQNGMAAVQLFENDVKFQRWIAIAQLWKEVIGGKLLIEIEWKCRKVLRLRYRYPFDLPACARKMYELVDRQLEKVMKQKKRAESQMEPLSVHASDTVDPRSSPSTFLASLEKKRIQRYRPRNGPRDRSRVSELVHSVRNAAKNPLPMYPLGGNDVEPAGKKERQEACEKMKMTSSRDGAKGTFEENLEELRKQHERYGNRFPPL